MSLAGVYTLEEIDAQIASIKRQLLAENQSYSISPADGGTSRSVSRNNRTELLAELKWWTAERNKLTGAHRGNLRVKHATFPRTASNPRNWEL